jgi:DNA-binding CsgD family transcriptional regulator/PAS domain-containing protein
LITDQQFDALICAIDKAAADGSLWPTALRLIGEACDASRIVLTRQGKSPGESYSIAPSWERAHAESYHQYYHLINPLWQRSISAPAGTVQTDEMIISKDEFVQTEFYIDLLEPHGLGSVLRTVAFVEHGRQTVITAHRQRAFEAKDIQLFERLTPHLQRAVGINVKFANLQMNNGTCAEALNLLEQGVLFVDKDGGLVFANREAEHFLAAGVLQIVDGRLRTYSAAETKRLHALIAECAQQGIEADETHMLSLASERLDTPLYLQIIPLRSGIDPIFLNAHPVAIIFASDPDRKIKQLISQITKKFQLTAAEAAVAREVLAGDGSQAVADRLKVTLATVRTHLAHIFAKTGTKRQAELVHLLLQQRHGSGAERK